MNYAEELSGGDCFVHDEVHYLLTTDFKKNGDRLAFSLVDGFPKWFNSNAIVSKVELYTLDSKNNILPIKENKNEISI